MYNYLYISGIYICYVKKFNIRYHTYVIYIVCKLLVLYNICIEQEIHLEWGLAN